MKPKYPKFKWKEDLRRKVFPKDIRKFKALAKKGYTYSDIGFRLGFTHSVQDRHKSQVYK